MILPDNFESKIGFDRVRSQIEALCLTKGAAAKMQQVSFSANYGEVVSELSKAFEMRSILMMESDFPSDGFVDTNSFLKKVEVEGTFLEVHEIVTLGKGLAMVGALVRFFAAKEQSVYPHLTRMSAGIMGFPQIVGHIETIIDKFGKIKDNASPELYEVRRTIRDKESQVSRRLQQIMAAAQSEGFVDSDASISIREGRAVIPVSASNKKKVRGFVHDESATGKTVYIEPIEVVEINNELKELEYRERREIIRILVTFTEIIRRELPQINEAGEYLTDMDLIRAKARHALANDCTLPIVNQQPGIMLRNARHLLLNQTLAREGKKIVPLDIALSERDHILIISGPNAGGKSVCLKTVGLTQYMLQCGVLVPVSENSEIGIFESIFIDIGDEQSIDNDLSTYSSHLLNMKNMLRGCNEHSLILIDEFGTGTEPIIGGAIAESILEKFRERGVYAVITTHYSNLKYYASNAQGVINGAMTFDVQNIQPLFRLDIGKPGSSFAIEIARKIGLPEQIIASAAEKAGSDHINLERQLREIARDKRYWEQKRDRIRIAEKRSDELAEKYRAELEALKTERSKILKEAKLEARMITDQANKQIENTIKVIKESAADKEKTLIVRRQMDAFKQMISSDEAEDGNIDRKIEQLREREKRRAERKGERAENASKEGTKNTEPPKPKIVELGAKVRIKDQDAMGEVMSISGKKATIGFGQILTTIAIDRLEVISQSEFKKRVRDSIPTQKPAASFDTMDRRLKFSQQIDLRGMRAAEALEVVMEYIDDATMLGFSQVRILHGKGTGALKEEIRKYLRSVAEVRSAVDEQEQMGGAGITVVDFYT